MHRPTPYTNPMYDRPQIQMIPLIDIMFFALIFFMILSVYYHVESQMDIHIPASSQSHMSDHTKTDMIVNINANGNVMVNGKNLTDQALDNLLQRTSASQNVIIRADKRTLHQDVIRILDLCAKNNIQDISFATQPNQT
jgi:biopolymer transport protein ExbD